MWPFRREAQPFLDDPVFGRIEFDDGSWSAGPADCESGFAIFVLAGPAGPSDVQRTFFQQLCPMLDNLHRQAAAFAKASGEAMDLAGKPVDLDNLHIYAVRIDADDECRDGVFGMEFSDSEAELIHEIEFKNYLPVSYGQSD